MDKIVRREFTGSWLLVTILCATVFGIPVAIMYLINHTIELHTDVSDSEEFMRAFNTRKDKH